MICALAVALSFGLRSYANAAFNPDVQITGTSSPDYWGTQWTFTLTSAFITFLEQNGYKELQLLLPSLPAPAFRPASISYISSNNLSSFGNLEVNFVRFLNQDASFKANSTQIASVSSFYSSPLGEYSLQSTSSEVSIQEEKEDT
ncbi:MAG: hypothetical protein J6S25_02550 [Aeriscardovia sp.]|nr:hypothetical protein [Aeriscardovia sp.]